MVKLFLKNKNSIRKLMETFPTFSQYSCLKPNYEKCDTAGIRVLKKGGSLWYGMYWRKSYWKQ